MEMFLGCFCFGCKTVEMSLLLMVYGFFLNNLDFLVVLNFGMYSTKFERVEIEESLNLARANTLNGASEN